MVGSRDAPALAIAAALVAAARRRCRRRRRRAATCASARRRTSSRPTRFKSVEAINVESQATSYYDQLIGLQAERPDASPTAHGAREGRRRLARRQDDHVPPAHGHPLVGRQAVHERRRAVDVQRRAAEQDEPAARRRSRRVKSVSAPDKNTFVLHLSTRDSEFLDKLAVPILPKHIWSKIPIAKLDKVDGPVPTVTTAPYQLTKWEKLGTTILSAQREVRHSSATTASCPTVKRILITYYANPDSIYRDVNQGNLDYGYGGQPSWARRAKTDNNENVQLVSAPRGGYWEIAFNSCPQDGLADLQRPGQGRQDRRRAGPRAAQGGGLRDRPGEVHPDRLRRSGHDRLRPDLAALQALLRRAQEHAARLRLRPRQGEAGAEGRRLGLLADARARRTA